MVQPLDSTSAPRRLHAAAGVALVCSGLLLGGCLPLHRPASSAPAPAAPASAAASAPAPAPVPAPVPAAPPPAQHDPAAEADAATRRLLAYHEQLRQLQPAELSQEVTRLNAMMTAQPSHGTAVELVILLGYTRGPGDTARAISLLDPVVRSTAPDALPWQPLARLLLARYVEQRKLEEQLDRQSRELRDSQRRLDQLNDKLEALKAIERSLNPRPPTPSGSAPKAP